MNGFRQHRRLGTSISSSYRAAAGGLPGLTLNPSTELRSPAGKHKADGRDRDEAPITVVYIASRGHSGSTLLDLLISAHSDIVSVGELTQLARHRDKRCTCGASRIPECSFWRNVDQHLQDVFGRRLDSIDVNANDSRRFVEDNLMVLRAVRAISGKDVIVDSSKGLLRLRRLQECEGLTLKPIFLRRRNAGVVYSYVRKGHSWLRHAVYGFGNTAEHLRLLREMGGIPVRYEELCVSPMQELRRVMNSLGLTFESNQLRWASRERHNIGGNRMRFSRDDRITLDEKWRGALSLHQRAVLDALDSDWLLRPAGVLRWMFRRTALVGGEAASRT